MTERRRRSIKAPSGPRKKEAVDPSKYRMNPPTMGRAEVPKPNPKPDPNQPRQNRSRYYLAADGALYHAGMCPLYPYFAGFVGDAPNIACAVEAHEERLRNLPF